MLDGFPPFSINIYVMGGVLVDSGTRFALGRIVRQLRGRSLTAHALTHAHPDHQGASHAICERLGLPLWCGAADAPAMESAGEIMARMPPHWLTATVGPHWVGPSHPVSRRLREGVVKFDVATGAQAKSKAAAPAYTKVYAEALIKEAKKDDKIIAITAAMPSGTGLDLFAKEFPDRCFDVGIAEQHGVTFAAGLATEGFKPFATIYSTFLQRAYDQVVHDVAIQRLPVRFAMDRAGLVGADGPTHAGAFDVAYLGCLPGFVVMAAADEADLVHMVATAAAIDDRPSALRYPRGEGMGVPMPTEGKPLEIGKGRILREGTKVALFSFGARLAECFKAADELAALGLSTTVADARFAKPLDTELLLRLAREHEVLITIEEGAIGGFAAHVLHALAANGVLDGGLKVRPMVLPDVFIDQDSPAAMYAKAGLDAKGIVATAFEALGQNLQGEAVKLGRG